jgi:hypothetical protein
MVSFKVHACTPDLSKVLKRAFKVVLEKEMDTEGDFYYIKRKYCYVPHQ